MLDHSIIPDRQRGGRHTGNGSNLRAGPPLKSETIFCFVHGETFPISAIGNDFLDAKLSCYGGREERERERNFLEIVENSLLELNHKFREHTYVCLCLSTFSRVYFNPSKKLRRRVREFYSFALSIPSISSSSITIENISSVR